MSEIICDFDIERFILEELPGRRKKKILDQLAKDDILKAKIQNIKKSDEDILKKFPPKFVVPEILNRYKNKKKDFEFDEIFRKKFVFFRRILYASPVLVSVIAILFLILPFQREKNNFSINYGLSNDLRIKGVPEIDTSKSQLIIFRKDGDRVELIKNTTIGKAGDLLQIGYVVTEESFGMIISIDGKGNITLHFPDSVNDSTMLEQYKRILLPNAIELDDSPGFERFFFLTSKTEIDVSEILRKAEKLTIDIARARNDKLDLPDTINQYSIIIIKGDIS